MHWIAQTCPNHSVIIPTLMLPHPSLFHTSSKSVCCHFVIDRKNMLRIAEACSTESMFGVCALRQNRMVHIEWKMVITASFSLRWIACGGCYWWCVHGSCHRFLSWKYTKPNVGQFRRKVNQVRKPQKGLSQEIREFWRESWPFLLTFLKSLVVMPYITDLFKGIFSSSY
jgi:hypothetical protein